jgi:hypothetical protein
MLKGSPAMSFTEVGDKRLDITGLQLNKLRRVGFVSKVTEEARDCAQVPGNG